MSKNCNANLNRNSNRSNNTNSNTSRIQSATSDDKFLNTDENNTNIHEYKIVYSKNKRTLSTDSSSSNLNLKKYQTNFCINK